MRVKHCANGHIPHKYSLTAARRAAMVVAVPSTVHYPDNYKINTYNIKDEVYKCK
jgi:hypothetical protein